MKSVGFMLWLSLAVSPAWALDGNAILQQVDSNLAPDSYEMYRKLINVEPDGSRKEFVLYTAKKGRESMVALFLAPSSDQGRTTLRLADNMWLYIPDVGKPLRITSLQSVVGGIFNNSDLMRLEFSTEYDVQSIAEEGDEYLLDLKAKTGAVAYDRLKMRVDKARILPTTIEAYAASGLLIKTLHYSKIKDYGDGIVRPSVLETDSPLYVGYKAVMLFAAIRPREFSDEVFTLNYMPRVQELR
jgi:outer membrane lipoprotein-sorting protein